MTQKSARMLVICALLIAAPLTFADQTTTTSQITIESAPSQRSTIPSADPYLEPDDHHEHIQAAQKDPLEKYNRFMFSVNEYLDKYILKPVATLYRKIVPRPMARGISNMYANVAMLPTTANDLLQGNFYQATSDAWRFAVNTTIGLAGFYDVSSKIGLEKNQEDFGLTLAKWGYTESTYIVLPLFGPSTIRDAAGMPVDFYAFSVYSRIDDQDLQRQLYALGAVSQRAAFLDYESLYNQAAVDKYSFVRNAYLQKRQSDIQRNTELNDPYYEVHGAQGAGVITIGNGPDTIPTDNDNNDAGVIVIGGNG